MVLLILLMSSLFIFARVSVDPDWDRSYHSVLELGRCDLSPPSRLFKVHPFQDMNMLLSHHRAGDHHPTQNRGRLFRHR